MTRKIFIIINLLFLSMYLKSKNHILKDESFY